jgi:DNA-binding response OmpR family regulator
MPKGEHPGFRIAGAQQRFPTISSSAREDARIPKWEFQLRKVLLVEDDEVQLRIREAVLKAAGFEVVAAATAESALPLIMGAQSNGKIDSVAIIITDHLLPGMSGVEFVHRVRAVNVHVTVVVLSGLPDAFAAYEGLDIIFRQKPCPPGEIVALVRQSFDSAA